VSISSTLLANTKPFSNAVALITYTIVFRNSSVLRPSLPGIPRLWTLPSWHVHSGVSLCCAILDFLGTYTFPQISHLDSFFLKCALNLLVQISTGSSDFIMIWRNSLCIQDRTYHGLKMVWICLPRACWKVSGRLDDLGRWQVGRLRGYWGASHTELTQF
jgi:hypothetical protein